MNKKTGIAKELVAFSMPLILSGILQQLYNWADAFIVGHSGANGEMMLAAVGATSIITIVLVTTITGFTLGLSILAAQEYGRGNLEMISRLAAVFLPIFSGIYAVFALGGIMLLRPILQIMDMPPEIFEYSCTYLQIVLVGIPVLAIYNLFAALFRAMGNTKVAFYAILLSSVLNIILDIILVLVLPFGVAGAAAATLISQIVMTIFIILYGKIHYPDLMKRRKGTGFDREAFRAGLSFGLPPMIQNSVTAVGNLVLQNFMNQFGAITVLAITTSYRVDSLMLLPVLNLGSAVSNLIARAKGEGSAEKSRNYFVMGTVLMLGVSGALTALMYFCGAEFVGFFGVTGEALEKGKIFFRDLSMFYVPFGIATVFRSALEGVGDIRYCSAVGIGTLGLRIAFSYILRPMMWDRAIAYAEAVAWCVLLLLMVGRVVSKRGEFRR